MEFFILFMISFHCIFYSPIPFFDFLKLQERNEYISNCHDYIKSETILFVRVIFEFRLSILLVLSYLLKVYSFIFLYVVFCLVLSFLLFLSLVFA